MKRTEDTLNNRRLFCGEKLQKSWGKETFISAMSLRSPDLSRLLQSSQKCEDDAMNWNYTQTHHNSSLLYSQRREGRLTLSLDWEMSVYMNTHNTPSDTSPPSSSPPRPSQLQAWAVQPLPLWPAGREHTCIQMHKNPVQEYNPRRLSAKCRGESNQSLSGQMRQPVWPQRLGLQTCTHK